MPLYEYKCRDCGKIFEEIRKIADRYETNCKCGGKIDILLNAPHKDWFIPHINEDFDGTPILVKSKRHLKELCKQHGVYSKAL